MLLFTLKWYTNPFKRVDSYLPLVYFKADFSAVNYNKSECIVENVETRDMFVINHKNIVDINMPLKISLLLLLGSHLFISLIKRTPYYIASYWNYFKICFNGNFILYITHYSK